MLGIRVFEHWHKMEMGIKMEYLSDSHGIWAHNHLIRERTLNHLEWNIWLKSTNKSNF